MSTINNVDAALKYVDSILCHDTNWENEAPHEDCDRVHFTNEDRDALQMLADEVARLRQDNDALVRATAVMGHRLDAALGDVAKLSGNLTQAGEVIPLLQNILNAGSQQWKLLHEHLALVTWYESRDVQIRAAVKQLKSYTTYTALEQWEEQNPKPKLRRSIGL